jgi:hypothetical protein
MGQDVGLGKALGANAQYLVVAPACRAGNRKANCQQELFQMHETNSKIKTLISVLHNDWPLKAAADVIILSSR